MKKILCGLLVMLLGVAACSDRQDVHITGPEIQTPVTYQYLKPFFDGKCATSGCHDAATAAAGYDMSTYAGVITRASADNESSPLLVKVQSGGSMNEFLGDYPDTRIEAIRQWIVDYDLQEN